MTGIGTLISERYRLEEKIGSGGMSSVYRAFDPTLERWVAIKLMHRDISADPDQLERFRREARAVAQLNHPHVVTVIDAGEDEGAPYIVFEYVEGETLKDRIRRLGRVLGTTDYVSPEQALGHEVTGQSDIYSLGIVLYEMLTGETPFKADTQVAVAMKHVRDPLPDVQRRRPEISAALAAVVEHSTAKETQNRYGTVDQMVHDLEEVLAIEAARTGEATGEATTVLKTLSADTADFAPIRLRRPMRALALSLLLLAALGATGVFLAARTEKGTGGSVVPNKPDELSEVRLAGNASSDYDPEGDNEESPDAARNAIDGNRSTNWNTETYQGGFEGSNKSGVGLFVDAGKLIAARGLTLSTAKPGFKAAVYGSETVPPNLRGWTRLSRVETVEEDHTFRLRPEGRRYRYYLLWISELPEGGKAEVQELSLLS